MSNRSPSVDSCDLSTEERDRFAPCQSEVMPECVPTPDQEAQIKENRIFEKTFFGEGSGKDLQSAERPMYEVYKDLFQRECLARKEYEKARSMNWTILHHNLSCLFEDRDRGLEKLFEGCLDSTLLSILQETHAMSLASMRKIYLEDPFIMLRGLIVSTVSTIQTFYSTNTKYDIIEIKRQVFMANGLIPRNKNEEDPNQTSNWKKKPVEQVSQPSDPAIHFSESLPLPALPQLYSLLTIETASYCEDFKTLWMQLLSSPLFFDTLDEADFSIKKFNQIITQKSKSQLLRFSCLGGLIKYFGESSSDSLEKSLETIFEEFSLNLGSAIFDYFQLIGKSARLLLERLDKKIQDAKFLTTHIAVCAVARLRNVLKNENAKNFKKIAYIMHVDSNLLHDFWKQALLHFDKLFTPKPIPVSDLNCRVVNAYLVERDGDERRGILFMLDGSFKKYIVHRDSEKTVFLKNSDYMSNRWKIVGAKIESLVGLIGLRLKQCINFISQEGIWDSTQRELDDLEEKPVKYSVCPLSRLLEDLIFSSRSLRDCVTNFTSNSAQADGMISFLVLQIPIVGGTFYTVMEFYGLGRPNSPRKDFEVVAGIQK